MKAKSKQQTQQKKQEQQRQKKRNENPVMNRDELLKRLDGIEWNDAEFKRARNEVPLSAYETVSAFANTHGGWLGLGISETPRGFEVTGVGNADKVQNDFLSALRADCKVNHDIPVQENLLDLDGKSVLVFHIPESPRHHKPIYLNGDIRRTFIRRGSGDQRATMAEIERFLRDAAEDRWDSQVFDFPIDEALDDKSIRWYRNHFHQVNPGHDEEQTDREFLYEWGYLVRDSGEFRPTRAAILLFGSPAAIHHLLPRPTLDAQWIPAGIEDPLPETRWLDRAVYEDNLIVTWQGLVAKYYQYEPRPFRDVDPHTLMRDDTPPGYRVFREAAVNLLIHQDYADHTRKAVIKFFHDCVQFWNPGDVFGSDENLLEPGEKEVRNPRIAAAFRRLALCEQAGTGLRMIQNQWQELGHPEPVLVNDRPRKAFDFRLPLAGQETRTPQAEGTKSGLSPDQVEIVHNLRKNKGIRDLMAAVGRKNRTKFRNQVLNPLIDAGYVQMTVPDKPRSSKQKYRLTDTGRQLLEKLPKENRTPEEE